MTKALACLFLGMGLGYMNTMNNLLFLIPMGLGLVFLFIDIEPLNKVKCRKDKQSEGTNK